MKGEGKNLIFLRGIRLLKEKLLKAAFLIALKDIFMISF